MFTNSDNFWCIKQRDVWLLTEYKYIYVTLLLILFRNYFMALELRHCRRDAVFVNMVFSEKDKILIN